MRVAIVFTTAFLLVSGVIAAGRPQGFVPNGGFNRPMPKYISFKGPGGRRIDVKRGLCDGNHRPDPISLDHCANMGGDGFAVNADIFQCIKPGSALRHGLSGLQGICFVPGSTLFSTQ
ncbi:hypothetical protein AX17_001559 [Amanita inopinata Kibby_2008]|nr:hypothetical protein AX17_001559 [Amanita inopinata Kibby_2008]